MGKIVFPEGIDLSYGATFVGAFHTSDGVNPVAATVVNPDGTYEFDVPAGDIVFAVVSEGRAVADRWGRSGTDFATAEITSLYAEPTTIDFTLAAAALVGGSVQFPETLDLTSGETFALVFDASDPEVLVNYAQIFDDGRFAIGGLGAGEYLLWFYSEGRALHNQYWQGVVNIADAPRITLAEHEVRDAIVEQLQSSATISGKVTVPSGFDLSDDVVAALVYDASGDGATVLNGGYVEADGTYYVGDLFAGDHRVEFVVAAAGVYGEWWNNKPTFVAASVIPLTEQQQKTGVNAKLETKRLLVTTTPIISGTAKIGQTLKVVAGQWTSGTKLTYQWYANGKAITNAKSTALKLSSSLAGKKITVKVTGSKSGYITASLTSTATKSVAKVLKTAAPTISGTVHVGKTLTAKAGTWTTGTRFTYQWYAAGTAIAGATSSSLKLSSAWAGSTITVKVTGTKSGYASATRTSKATAKVLKTLSTTTPTIMGSTKFGQTLSAQAGSWTAGTSLTYQWYANGAAIPKATSTTLKLTASLVGKKITVKVTGKQSGFASASRTSKVTSRVSYPTRTRPVSLTRCPSWAPIKGNADSGIYHLPHQRFYDQTHPEECFRTESAAVAAGYRKAKV